VVPKAQAAPSRDALSGGSASLHEEVIKATVVVGSAERMPESAASDEDDPEQATAAAHAWAVAAINATGDSTRGWATFAHPEQRERVPV
jgi:hypothetical protein